MENLHRFWHCSQTIYTGSNTSYSRSDPVDLLGYKQPEQVRSDPVDLLGYKQPEQVLTKVTHTKIQVFFQEISTGSYIAQWLFTWVLTQVTDFETEVLICFLPDPVIWKQVKTVWAGFTKIHRQKNACLFSGNLHRFWHCWQTAGSYVICEGPDIVCRFREWLTCSVPICMECKCIQVHTVQKYHIMCW